MTQVTADTVPREILRRLEVLGERIRIARVRRDMGTQELAQECGIGRRSLYRIETGDAGVALGTYLTVLWKLGMLDTVQGVANPDEDEHGKILEAVRRPARVRARAPQDNDF